MDYSTITLVVGAIYTIVGFIRDDSQYIVGAQPWLAATIILVNIQ